MTKNRTSAVVGDKVAPPLAPNSIALRHNADEARHLEIETAPAKSGSSTINKIAQAAKNASRSATGISGCKRAFWLSFFFDGTGNNLDADLGLLKHSCIARLFMAHKPADVIEGTFPIYIPGLGTYFPEIGDEGGTLGKAFALGGEKRLEFALAEFDRLLKKPVITAMNPKNAIQEINLAIFGFSRGAALARAFANIIMEKRCTLRDGSWRLKTGNWPVRFRFMGLFDTVASVGNPMSRNNTDYYNPAFSDVHAVIAERLEDYPDTRPEILAFSTAARPGADPAPGCHAGHDAWGEKLKIDETVEEVWHFVAAHESRNSFPLDSISILNKAGMLKPRHFHEVLYLGAHSDVGGGYAPGEGGKSLLPEENLCLVPLKHMYDYALRAGVPMAVEWTERNKDDFRADEKMVEIYNHYLKAMGSPSSLGEALNKHIRYYFAWRFSVIRKNGRRGSPEENAVRTYDGKFQKVQTAYSKELVQATRKEVLAQVSRNALVEAGNMAQADDVGSGARVRLAPDYKDTLARVEKHLQNARASRLSAQARKDAVPDMTSYQQSLELYDKQLIADVSAIRSALGAASNEGVKIRSRKDLRPHYAALLETWENEFLKNNGLKDEGIISFFSKYMHDSLAGFAKDATLPSDPRVVYVGGDTKLRFANIVDERLEEMTRSIV